MKYRCSLSILQVRLLVLSVLLAGLLRPADSLAQTPADSLSREWRGETFHARQLIAPGALMVVGAWGVSNGFAKKVKNEVKDGLADLRGNHYLHFDDYVQYTPFVAFEVLDFCGVKGKHSFRERVAMGATAWAINGLIVQVPKRIFREKRPDTDSRNSFPSGHTTTAFMGAELVRAEYGNAAGIPAYVVATGIAFMRMYNERHWLNDVIAGAGCGIFAAQAARWLLPLERRLLGWKREGDRQLMVVPTVMDGGEPGLSLVVGF